MHTYLRQVTAWLTIQHAQFSCCFWTVSTPPLPSISISIIRPNRGPRAVPQTHTQPNRGAAANDLDGPTKLEVVTSATRAACASKHAKARGAPPHPVPQTKDTMSCASSKGQNAHKHDPWAHSTSRKYRVLFLSTRLKQDHAKQDAQQRPLGTHTCPGEKQPLVGCSAKIGQMSSACPCTLNRCNASMHTGNGDVFSCQQKQQQTTSP